ncbi:MAG: hypothetical protein IJB79_05460 [Candidatus Gastranaerophilales bacterium]|nr:hypothetical protein [Candidatus Gastranaerophilales bacterium]
MNIKINSLNFNFIKKQQKSPKEKNNNQTNLSHFSNNRAYIDSLKTQILFKGNFNKDSINDTLAKYDLTISPEAFDYVAQSKNIDTYAYSSRAKKGEEIFDLFLRAELHKKFPKKSEGALTNAIQLQLLQYENISRISKELFGDDFSAFANSKNKFKKYFPKEVLTKRFYALLGTIAIDRKEKGYQDVLSFLDKHAKEKLLPDDFNFNKTVVSKKKMYFGQSPLELFHQIIEEQGCDSKDFEFETKAIGNSFQCKIYYKNNELVRVKEKSNRQDVVKQSAIYTLLQKIANHEIDLESYEWQEKKEIDYSKPDKERLKKLEEFSKKINVNFNDINLLNKAFLARTMPNRIIIPACESYQVLEYIGDGVLQFCTHEILNKNFPKINSEQLSQKTIAFVKNEKLIEIAKRLKMDELVVSGNPLKEKHCADIFEALVGAIFLDGGIYGLDNVCQFLDNNFKEEILNA